MTIDNSSSPSPARRGNYLKTLLTGILTALMAITIAAGTFILVTTIHPPETPQILANGENLDDAPNRYYQGKIYTLEEFNKLNLKTFHLYATKESVENGFIYAFKSEKVSDNFAKKYTPNMPDKHSQSQ